VAEQRATPVTTVFPPPLRSGGNAALSGSACLSPPLRYGENQALNGKMGRWKNGTLVQTQL